MRRAISLVASSIAICGIALGPLRSIAASPDTVRATEESFMPEYQAYAQVTPKALVTMRTSATGVIGSLSVLPGERVHAGSLLAMLGGPEFNAELRRAQAELVAAKRNYDITKHNYPHFSSAQDLDNARAAFKRARAQSDRLRAAGRLIVPCDGVVLALDAADGERLGVGQAVVTLQADAGLWLKAAYFGKAISEIHPGMTGQFIPADGGKPIFVKVVTKFAALAGDGGESIGLMAVAGGPGWRNGEYGIVKLRGAARKAAVVPTRALILNRSHWWVMLRTPQGLRRREVIPGPTRGWQTLVERGLHQGDLVVVENAYLDFHRSIAKKYTPPG